MMIEALGCRGALIPKKPTKINPIALPNSRSHQPEIPLRPELRVLHRSARATIGEGMAHAREQDEAKEEEEKEEEKQQQGKAGRL